MNEKCCEQCNVNTASFTKSHNRTPDANGCLNPDCPCHSPATEPTVCGVEFIDNDPTRDPQYMSGGHCSNPKPCPVHAITGNNEPVSGGWEEEFDRFLIDASAGSWAVSDRGWSIVKSFIAKLIAQKEREGWEKGFAEAVEGHKLLERQAIAQARREGFHEGVKASIKEVPIELESEPLDREYANGFNDFRRRLLKRLTALLGTY